MHAQTLRNAYDLLIVIFRASDPSILQWYNDGVSLPWLYHTICSLVQQVRQVFGLMRSGQDHHIKVQQRYRSYRQGTSMLVHWTQHDLFVSRAWHGYIRADHRLFDGGKQREVAFGKEQPRSRYALSSTLSIW
jgi:hypothetical protein